ncbi:MAG: tetratricopeptide repeat protein [Bacteroidetes bacterium]|nr:tetratricopeptide repeat protein [Bacteroidota bacterium]
MRMRWTAVCAAVLMVFIAGCSSGGGTAAVTTEAPAPKQRAVTEQDRSAAMQLFIDGSLKESKGEFAEAILDYQDALRYDHDPAIFFALAKCYHQLRRYAAASEYAALAVQHEPNRVEYREVLAQTYINAGKLDKAAAEFRMILMLDPKNVNAAFTLAKIMERAHPAEALELYNGIVARQGPSWEVLLQIAQLNSALQRHDKAAEALEQMLQLDPSNLALKQNLAETYIRLKRFEQARTMLTEVLEQNPDNVMLRSTLADVYLQQNDWTSARKELTTILASDSLDPDTHLRIGMAYYAQTIKDTLLIPEAIGVFRQYEKNYPTDTRPFVFLGVLHRGIRKDSIAETYFTRATQAANWNGDAWWQLGWMYFDKQDYRETISIMTKAKQYVPDDFRIFLLLGIAHNRAGQQQDSRVALERAAELNPTDLNVLSSLGLTYDALKMHAESDSTYERALRIDPDYPLVLNNYAYSLSERGIQLSRAATMSKASLAADSTNSSYLDTYGWILYQQGKYDEALVYIRRAVELGDASAVVLEHLGDVYYRVGDRTRAEEYWKKALEKDAKNAALKEKIARGSL